LIVDQGQRVDAFKTLGKGEYMKRKQPFTVILIAAFAGFIGGLTSNQIVQRPSAFAEKGFVNQKVVIAEEFQVVNQDGKIVGRFGTSNDPPDLSSDEKISKASVAQLHLGQETGFQIILSAGEAEGSRIILKDAGNKTRTVIGNMQLYITQTRVTHNRQVSSIVLFDNLGRFLWSAPGGIQTDLSR
jgi:hypothetical protein